ncbi:MAG TPA: kelch repeat-containing protein, partial [Bryobacteraceae bacterium]|nr:kelch repeat-containing protein [Bryobacteraceae bacterium]
MFFKRNSAIGLGVLLAAALVINGAKTVDGTYQTHFASARGIMGAERGNAASVSMKDGRVLLIGGQSSRGVLSSVETYEVGVGFRSAAAMRYPRSEHGAALLPDGRVLVMGGRANSGSALSDTEIYNPETDIWSAGPEMLSPHAGATVSLLKDGRILIAGGDSGTGPSDQLEIYDPATSSFAAARATLSSHRTKHAAAVLENGNVLIGGGTDGTNALDSVDLFNAKTGKVSPAGHLSVGRSALSATTMLNGRVLFAGGNNGKADLATADVFDPAAGAIVETALMSSARSGHNAIRIANNNTVILIGGASNGKALAGTATYIPWRHKFQSGAELSNARTGASVNALPGGKILAAGGMSANLTYGNAETSCQPSIKTDKADYAPGTPVIFSGDCWIPGGTVTISMLEDPNIDTPATVSVTVDPDGTFVTPSDVTPSDKIFAPDVNDIGVKFYVTATEPNSADPAAPLTAQTFFTDGTLSVLVPSGVWVSANWTGNATPVICNNATCSLGVKNNDVLTMTAYSSAALSTPVNVSWGTLPTGFTPNAGSCANSTSTCNATIGNLANGALITVTSQSPQTITFNALANKIFGDADFTLSATATSGLTVAFSSATTAVCTISGSAAHIVATGTCTINADQSGDTTFSAAPQVARSFTVAKANQTITFGAPGGKTFGGVDFPVSATASSGLTVAFSSATAAVCTV